MKRRFLRILFILTPVAILASDPPLLDLERCIQQALSQNPALVLAADDLSIATARRHAATAGLYPALSFKADSTKGRADNDDENQPFVKRTYGAQATQTLFAGGRMWATQRQSSLAAEVAEMQFEKQRQEVRHAVTEAYWRVAALQKAMDTHRETYRLLQEDLEKAARQELSAARAARIQLLSTRAQNRESEAAVAETDEELIAARIALMDAMGQRLRAEFRIPADLPKGSVAVDEEEALRLAHANRPDLRIADRLMQSAQYGRQLARSGYFPKIDLNGFYGRSAAAFIETEPLTYKKDWNASLNATWPIFGNSLKFSSVKEETSPNLGESSRTELDSQSISLGIGDALSVGITNRENRKSFHEEEWRYEKTRRDLDDEVRLAVRRVTTTRSRRDGARARYEESLQGMKDVRALFQDDRAHLGDIASARNRAAFASAAYAQAQANYLIAISALNRAVGVPHQYRVEP